MEFVSAIKRKNGFLVSLGEVVSASKRKKGFLVALVEFVSATKKEKWLSGVSISKPYFPTLEQIHFSFYIGLDIIRILCR